jgi:hypothetical protein
LSRDELRNEKSEAGAARVMIVLTLHDRRKTSMARARARRGDPTGKMMQDFTAKTAALRRQLRQSDVPDNMLSAKLFAAALDTLSRHAGETLHGAGGATGEALGDFAERLIKLIAQQVKAQAR